MSIEKKYDYIIVGSGPEVPQQLKSCREKQKVFLL